MLPELRDISSTPCSQRPCGLVLQETRGGRIACVDAGVVPPLVALLRCGPMSAAAEAAVEAISWIAEENNVDEYEAGSKCTGPL
jgi:hypothetical protein